jgi:hypothetical protein
MKTFPDRNASCGKDCANAAQRAPKGAEQLTPLQEHRLKIENRELREQLNGVLGEQVFNQRYQDFIAAVDARKVAIPSWIKQIPAKGSREVMPTAAMSDWHLDEVVRPEQVQNLNAYNRDIAEQRLHNFFQNTEDICFKYLSGFKFPGLVLPWLGDMFSGNIHEELRATNADVVLSSLLHWVGPMVSGVRRMADVFGKVYIPVVVGNHGRNTIKPIHKNRVRDNFDWLFAQIVSRELSGDKRVTFDISESPDFAYNVYTTAYHITHGDQAKGGSGIAAQLSPLMIMVARKMKRSRFDYLVCGHWHRLSSFMKVRVNGSGVGYNEYAFNGNFEYEPPQQDLWLTDPQYGIVGSFPVHVQSSQEPWLLQAKASALPIAA